MVTQHVSLSGVPLCRCTTVQARLQIQVDEQSGHPEIRCLTCSGTVPEALSNPNVTEVREFRGCPSIFEMVHDDGNVFTITSKEMFGYRAWKLYQQWYFEQYKVVYIVAGAQGWSEMIGLWGAMAVLAGLEDEDPIQVMAQGLLIRLQGRMASDDMDQLLNFHAIQTPMVRVKKEIDGKECEVILISSERIKAMCGDYISVEKFAHISRMNKWTLRSSDQIRYKGRRFRVWFFDPDVLFPKDFEDMKSETQKWLDEIEAKKNAEQQKLPGAGDVGPSGGNGTESELTQTASDQPDRSPESEPTNGKLTQQQRLERALAGVPKSPRPKDEGVADIRRMLAKLDNTESWTGVPISALVEASGRTELDVRALLEINMDKGVVYSPRTDHYRAY